MADRFNSTCQIIRRHLAISKEPDTPALAEVAFMELGAAKADAEFADKLLLLMEKGIPSPKEETLADED